jgi:MATE family multidrug resistance protein
VDTRRIFLPGTNGWLAEVKPIVRLAAPLTGGYLLELAKAITGMIIVGRMGSTQLAAVNLSVDVLYSFMMTPIGILSMVAIVIGAAKGKENDDAVATALRDGAWLALMLSIPSMFLCLALPHVFALCGQGAEVVSYARAFLTPVAVGLIPWLLFVVLRGALAALGRAAAGITAIAIGIVLNVPLCYGLVHGSFGLPRLGVAGAGIASAIVNWIMLLVVGSWMLISTASREPRIARRPDARSARSILGLLKLGLPAGAAGSFEYGGFVVITIIMGTLGPKVLAANQIVFNTIFVISLVAYGNVFCDSHRFSNFRSPTGNSCPIAARTSGHHHEPENGSHRLLGVRRPRRLAARLQNEDWRRWHVVCANRRAGLHGRYRQC